MLGRILCLLGLHKKIITKTIPANARNGTDFVWEFYACERKCEFSSFKLREKGKK